MTKVLASWHLPYWQRLCKQIHGQALHRAYLFVESQGQGMQSLVQYFIKAALCLQKQNDDDVCCNQCASCQQFDRGAHPDFLTLQPAMDEATFGIDAVRMLIDWLATTPTLGAIKFVWLQAMEQLTVPASHALLKTLEEPGQYAYFALTTAGASFILPTIKSRCQVISIPPATCSQAKAYLEAQAIKRDHSFAYAMALESPYAYASMAAQAPLWDAWWQWVRTMPQRYDQGYKLLEQLLDKDTVAVIDRLLCITAHFIKAKFRHETSMTYIQPLIDEALLGQLSYEALLGYYKELIAIKRAIHIQRISFNQSLLIDSLLSFWLAPS